MAHLQQISPGAELRVGRVGIFIRRAYQRAVPAAHHPALRDANFLQSSVQSGMVRGAVVGQRAVAARDGLLHLHHFPRLQL